MELSNPDRSRSRNEVVWYNTKLYYTMQSRNWPNIVKYVSVIRNILLHFSKIHNSESLPLLLTSFYAIIFKHQ